MFPCGLYWNGLGNGCEIDMPEDYDILWLRVHHYAHTSCIVYYRDHNDEIIGEYLLAKNRRY